MLIENRDARKNPELAPEKVLFHHENARTTSSFLWNFRREIDGFRAPVFSTSPHPPDLALRIFFLQECIRENKCPFLSKPRGN